ncbi:hypothetical protein ANANG_G00199570 [Anguilla anguilla]|uniref:Uncharacterized protein n=1 Tax=Anguilla anguilla TaxID=7936 RepID=A0A9D3M2N2_ANGAN|nr:hypothetical protein ANANG_G00199570 [Anguilla anguilla]
MGESGSRRSTLVSRLPIFRRSASKRQDSLPSSPSSGGVGNGVHTSSPSSTNSSSSSTGKRRSLFRTPSISFHSKRSSEPPPVGPAQPAPEAGFQRAADDGGGRCKTRHSFGFGGHRHKKISRSQTEDFDKASTNRNVFINCISSGANEGDDSGFLDDYSGSRRSSKHRKPLLPKSFSSHHRFSKHLGHAPTRPRPRTRAGTPKTGTPGSCPGELGESSLQSPMLSEDRTTAVTPSEFVPVTEDSSPPDPRRGGPRPDSAPSAEPAPPPKGEEPEEGGRESEAGRGRSRAGGGGGGGGGGSDAEERLGEQTERRHRNTVVIQEPGKGAGCVKPEARPCHLRKPHAGSVCSSVSPYREALRSERRLRSASGGGGPAPPPQPEGAALRRGPPPAQVPG